MMLHQAIIRNEKFMILINKCTWTLEKHGNALFIKTCIIILLLLDTEWQKHHRTDNRNHQRRIRAEVSGVVLINHE